MERRRAPAWPFSLPRRTLRVQLTLLYGALFFVLCVALLTIANVPVLRGSSQTAIPVSNSPANAIANAQHGVDVHRFVVSSAVALVVSVALSLVLGWLIAGRLLRPLRTITATAREISASNLHRRLALEGPDDEFRELGATLDDLFGRLEASFDSQRHFVANASHELRTPLTAERSLLQVALADPGLSVESLRAACEEVLQLGAQQERLIDGLLTLASSEGGVVQWEPIDLGQVAGTVILARRAETERRGISVESTLLAAPTVGDPNLVESLMANLVDNALRHNTDGGRVEVTTFRRDGRAVLAVNNTGPVIAADEVERLFQPFRQRDDRIGHGDGHGLGLAIVRAIATAHRATMTARARAGGGLEVEVQFPA
ncbi:MAG TPA: HAMP domain-containing sensor histidine kinase [Acidimicrobiales bacterium]|jgi:signal transduction histidine kinase|nr:HAMP domain-containing sensor histidine kinase [Acidimicrobiales bacterium]